MHLIDIGRNAVLERAGRPLGERLVRRALAEILPRPWLFAPLVALGRLARPLLPRALAEKVPAATPAAGNWPESRQSRRMLTIAGCVQPTLSPEINAATARVLARLGISLTEAKGAGCCGALRTHLDFQEQGRDDMRRMIDACWPFIEKGFEAIVVTASGCGSTMKDYGHALAHDPAYAAKAKRIGAMTRDVSEVIAGELPRLEKLVAGSPGKARRAAFHPPCSLQHGQKITGVTERILAAAGFDLTVIPDSHLCCGSAGTYSILQPALAEQLKRNKLAAICSGLPEQILTANIGCQAHLAEGTKLPVRHWIVALEERLG
jgi:glycolate oxidase iron-sulfur subunit